MTHAELVVGLVRLSAALTGAIVVTGGVLAQPSSPLIGPPKLEVDPKDRRSLVEIDYAGRVRAPDGTIEEAAVRKLDLDLATRERIDRVLAERARLMDDFVNRNLRLIDRFGTASESGRNVEALAHGLRLWQQGQPIRDHGRLRERIAAELADGERREFDRLIGEYMQTLRRDGVPKGQPPRAWIEVVIQERFRGLQSELEQSFARQTDGGEEALDQFLDGLQLDAQQHQRIRALLEDSILERGFAPTKNEQALMAAQILAYLDEDARQRVIERFADLDREKADVEMGAMPEEPADADAMAAPPPRSPNDKHDR